MSNPKLRPTHRIYTVTKKGDVKPFWFEIGAAWPNKDAKGFSLKFNALPIGDCEIVLREVSAEQEDAA